MEQWQEPPAHPLFNLFSYSRMIYEVSFPCREASKLKYLIRRGDKILKYFDLLKGVRQKESSVDFP